MKRRTLRERAMEYLNRRGSTTDGTTYWMHDQVDIFVDGYEAGYRAAQRRKRK